MADILDVAQSKQSTAQQTNPIESNPVPSQIDKYSVAPVSDTVNPPNSPPDKVPKKKAWTVKRIVMLLFLLIAIPITMFGVKYTLNLFGIACDPEETGYCNQIKRNQQIKNAPAPPSGSGGTGGGTTGGTYSGAQPQGTYPVYEGGASSGTVVGYRYIQAPGVIEGAIQRAINGNAADKGLLATQYGLAGSNLADAASHLSSGQTWVPAGVGCSGTVESQTVGNPSYCGDWHWTTCIGGGIQGIGCGTSGGGSPNNPPGSPEPTATPTPPSVPTNTPTPTPTNGPPGPTNTPTPTPTPSPTPVPPSVCNSACTINADCPSGLVCIDAACRNASCTTDASCNCPAPVAYQQIPKTPISGGPTILGASVIGIGMLILILGLAL